MYAHSNNPNSWEVEGGGRNWQAKKKHETLSPLKYQPLASSLFTIIPLGLIGILRKYKWWVTAAQCFVKRLPIWPEKRLAKSYLFILQYL